MLLNIDNAAIYYEVAGAGQPLVFIHAGVADSRQWNNEFEIFASGYQVIRYDLRGYGKSEPAEGEFNYLHDLAALLDHLKIEQPAVIIGCSMGGGLALDFAVKFPGRVAALVLVAAAPSGLELDVEEPEKFLLVEEAEKAGDLDLVAELETQIWFDGGRDTDSINKDMRKLAFDMNRQALAHDSMHLGTRLPNTEPSVSDRFGELDVPVLAMIGSHDIPYMYAALEFMIEKIPNIQTAKINNAAHMPNMDDPAGFYSLVANFLGDLQINDEITRPT